MSNDSLQPSTQGIVTLTDAIMPRLSDVLDLHIQLRGTSAVMDANIERDLVTWNAVLSRHQRGDFRNTESEKKAIQSIAQWSLDMNCELRGQPSKKIEWSN